MNRADPRRKEDTADVMGHDLLTRRGQKKRCGFRPFVGITLSRRNQLPHPEDTYTAL